MSDTVGNTNDDKAEASKELEHLLPEQQRVLKQAIEDKFGSRVTFLKSSAWLEFGLTISVPREQLSELVQYLKNEPVTACDMLIDITCVDWLDQKDSRFELVYQLLSTKLKSRLTIKVYVPEEDPVVPSVLSLWPGANFLEREVFDMYGIKFEGHGDLRRILMYDEFVGHPLRKDYPLRGKQPRVKLRVPELRNTSADLSRERLVALPSRRGNR